MQLPSHLLMKLHSTCEVQIEEQLQAHNCACLSEAHALQHTFQTTQQYQLGTLGLGLGLGHTGCEATKYQ